MSCDVKNIIKQKAKEFGFDDIGFAKPELSFEEHQKLEIYQDKGFAKQMPWLTNDINKRSNPKELWQEAKTAICLLINITPSKEQLEKAEDKKIAGIAFHAQGEDYHKVMKKRLVKLGKFIKQEWGADFRAFVDTAPIMEKPLAEKAGIGWQGRHSLIVSKKYGSFVLLGEILLNIAIKPDTSHQNHCGSCQKCVDACPVGAISFDGKVDILKCIAYQTIENKEEIPKDIAGKMGNKIYGCDACALACPFNHFIKESQSILNPRFFNLNLEDLITFDEEKFNEFFKGTGIKRIGFARFKRNLICALKNQI